MTTDSPINLGIPDLPLTEDKSLFRELVPIYNALKIFQQILTDTGISGGTGSSTTGYIDASHISGSFGDLVANSFIAAGVTVPVAASTSVLDYSAGSRWISRGAAAVQGIFSLVSTKGDGSSVITRLSVRLGGDVNIPSTLQITGLNNPAAGAGVEIAYTGGAGYLIAYDRTGAAYTPMNIGGSTVGLSIGGVTKLSIDTGGNIIGAAEIRAGNSLQALGADVTATASSSVLDYSGGTRLVAVGPDNATNATISLISVRSDVSNLITGLSISAAGNITIPQHKAGTTTRAVGDCYLLVDANGNIHVSAVGPAS